MKQFHIKTGYIDEQVVLQFGHYGDGSTAIQLFGAEDFLPAGKATVSLQEFNRLPKQGNVFIKSWSENKGLMETMVEAGIIGQPLKSYGVNGVEVFECPLLVSLEDGLC